MKVAYIAPVFKPAIGGGVVYLDLLSRFMVDSGEVERISILTEKFPNAEKKEDDYQNKLEIWRLFPFRAGRTEKNFKSYFQYLIQNLQFLIIGLYINRIEADVVFIHSSFHNHKNFLNLGLGVLKFFNSKVKLISDVRDPKLPKKRFKELKRYHKVISCSENVSQHLGQDAEIKEKIIQIPVPIERIHLEYNEVEKTLVKFGLKQVPFIFNGSGCSKEKGVLQSLWLVKQLNSSGYDLKLVVAGKKRYWDDELRDAHQQGILIYVGEIDHEQVIMLSRAAKLDVNLSTVDSMPRHSLEAMSVGSLVLLPRGVPEFEQDCPDCISDQLDEQQLVAKAKEILTNNTRCGYDWTQHLPEKVFPLYLPLLRDLIKK